MEQTMHRPVVADSQVSERATFIRKTYTHLAFAILAFVGLEAALMQMPFVEKMAVAMTNGYMWLIVLGAFMLVSYLAEKWAMSSTSKQTQYIGLGIYILAEAIIFVPLIYLAVYVVGNKDILPSAAIITLALFTGLSAVVFMTRKDFSFLRSILVIGFFVALGLIVASIIFGFNLGIIFSGAMIILASVAILYNTSNVLHHYNTEQYVAASLSLFAAIALLFWYILSFLLQFMGDD